MEADVRYLRAAVTAEAFKEKGKKSPEVLLLPPGCVVDPLR